MTGRNKTILAQIALLLCGLVWGTGFVVMKNALDYLPVGWLLGIRFTLSGILLSLVFYKKMRALNRRTLLVGALAGLLIYVAFYAQTLGLSRTTAGNNAFLTAIYVVLVPFLEWFTTKKRPGMRAVFAGLLCLIGVGVIALDSNLKINTGDAFTLLSGVLYAVHIVVVAHFTKRGTDVMALTCLQFLVAGVCGLMVATLTETPPAMHVLFSNDVLFAMLYLVLLCTLFGMVMQNVGLVYAPAAHASLLLGTEAPFGCLAGIVFLNEPFDLRFFAGILLIAGAIVWSSLDGNKQAAAPSQAE